MSYLIDNSVIFGVLCYSIKRTFIPLTLTMPARKLPDKFLVSFSFAGEQRELVRTIAETVEKKLGSPNVFYDEWFEHYLAGHDADLKLQKIYIERSKLVVVCVSERYGGQPWTRAEHESIRARVMEARTTADEHDDLRILPIRVGNGEVEGIFFNTIVPDVRTKSATETAELIFDRLCLIHPGLVPPAAPDWPEQLPPLHWTIADHEDVSTAFDHLLTRMSPLSFLLLCGPSEAGKSYITRQMLDNALLMPDLACGRFDFKGTTDMDDELRALVQHLDVSLPPTGTRLNECLSCILDSLKQRAQPALLIFDTYEAAGEAEEWVVRQLLPSLIRTKWLRVVIAGQRVPELIGTMREAKASSLIKLKPPHSSDWLKYGKRHRPDLTLSEVKIARRLACDRAALLAQLLGPTA